LDRVVFIESLEMTRTIPNPPVNIAGYDPLRTAGDCAWDGEEAARAVDFFSQVLTHPDDSHFAKAGDPLALQKWQVDYIATLFGWKRPDGSRRYTESLAALPRKNGKSTLAAGIILYGLVADGRTAGQFYTAAETRDQASLIYRMAARMVRQSPLLAKRLKPIDSTRTITYQSRGSFLRSIPSEAGPVHGTKPATVIFDELHTQKTRDLYDALRTGQGATPNPLFISITTAGHDRHSICFDLWNTARQVRDGTNPNPYFLPLIYELKDGEDWKDESTWEACNPNLGVSISWEFLREECQRAKDSPAYENVFRNLYLNEWTEQAVRWLSMDKWRLGNEPLPDLTGEPCWSGLDLSTTTDLSAFAMAFPRNDGGFYLLLKFWAPQERARQRANRDRVPYLEWAQKGFLTLTPGDVVDYDVIRADINALNEQYSIQDIAIDRWNAAQITTQLQGDGFNVTAFGQGYASMSPAAKEFEKLVVEGALQHGDNPVLNWMAANVAIEQDAAGNIKPSKKKSTERIDGIVAAVMAVGTAATARPKDEWWNPSDGVLL
jgi:phage terminase large subunit-like protein